MKFLNSKTAKTVKLSAILTLCLTFICCLCIALTGLFGLNSKNLTANATVHGQYIDLDTEDGRISLKAITDLVGIVYGGNTWSYSEIKSSIGSGVRTENYFNTTVKLGGLEWQVVLLSKATGGEADGELILTLWLADAISTDGQNAVQWNKWAENNTSYAYPSNMYSSSFIRSQLVGTPYAATAGATTLTAGNAAPVWAEFVSKYGEYMVEPAYSARQGIENSINQLAFTYLAPNEAYGTPAANSSSSTTNRFCTGFDYSSKTGYNDWKNDKLWIPSLFEVGRSADYPGYWLLSDRTRENSTTATWTRTGANSTANNAFYVSRAGQYGVNTPTSAYSVRPAFHLNLYKALQDAESQTIDLGENGNFNAEGVNSLYAAIGGQGVNSYADMKRVIDKRGVVTAVEIGTKVTLGGLTWDVVYGSKTKDGRVIATLWLDDVCFTDGQNAVYYNRWSAANSSYTYPSSMYSSSYIRSQLMGTSYVATAGAASLTVATAAPVWENLRASYGDYMVTPANVAWQQDMGELNISESGYFFPNNVYGTPSGNGVWFSSSSINMNYTSKPGYTGWQNDKLWIPSMREANYTSGLWGTNRTINANSSDIMTWMRDSRTVTPAQSYALRATGAALSGNEPLLATNNQYAVRPAFHLDLTAVAGEANISTSDNNIGNIYNDTAGAPNSSVLTSLYSAVTDGKTNYSGLNEYLRANGELSSKDIRANNNGNNVLLSLGGLEWDVTYVSKTRSGDIIATLWLDDVTGLEMQSFGTSASANPSITYPSNMYSSSKIRAILNGTAYSESQTATSLTDGADLQLAVWKNLIDNYSQFMVAPVNVDWQATESAYDVLGMHYDHVNDAYGTPSSGGRWYSDLSYDMSVYEFKSGYNDWANDYLWLPSIVETGIGAENASGIWQTNRQIRLSSSYDGSEVLVLLRSGRPWNANGPQLLGTTGDLNVTSSTSNSYYRPAMHLNLTELAKAAGDSYFNESTDLINMWNAAVLASLTNRGSVQTVTLTHDWTAVADSQYTTSFGSGVGFKNGALLVPKGANIVLDLNGYKVDRNLNGKTEEGIPHGRVITVEGNFTLDDGKGGGSLTGGCAQITSALENVSQGGAVLIQNGGKFVMNGGTLANNSAFNGAVYSYESTFIFNGGKISNNHSWQNGSAVFTDVSSYMEMNGGEVSYNVAEHGGAIIVYRDTRLVMNGGIITRNLSKISGRNGGGIRGDQAYVVINDGEISYNEDDSGGGVSANRDIEINGGYIHHNIARVAGGGLFVSGTATAKITGGIISENVSLLQGGGIYASGASVKIIMNGGEVSENSAYTYGGVYLNNTQFIMNGGKISGNTATNTGAGLGILGGTVATVNGGEISNNVSNGEVAGVHLITDSVLNLNGGVITGNRSARSSGGIGMLGATLNMAGGVITGNYVQGGGGGLYVNSSSTVNVTGGVIIGNFKEYIPSGSTTLTRENNDIYLTGGQLLNLTSKLPDVSRFGVNGANGQTVTKGYTSTGNNTANNFTPNYGTFTTSGGELVLNGTTHTSRSRISWVVDNGSGTAVYDTAYVSYVHKNGVSYTLTANVAGGAIAISTMQDESGRPVTSVSKVGKYYFRVTNPINYANPIFCLEILPESIENAEITVGEVTYNGAAQIPSVTVALNGGILVEGRDYTLSATNNVNAGTAKVYVTGTGNYTGVINKEFTINQRNLNVRWGNLSVEFNGEAQGATALAEGLLNGDSVEVVLTYTDADDNWVAVPVNAGRYRVYVSLGGNINYKLSSGQGVISEEDFVIVPKTVEARLENSSGTYNGEIHNLSVYFINAAGERENLVFTIMPNPLLTDGDVVRPGAYSLSMGEFSTDGNYRVSPATRTLTYTVNRAEAEWSWNESTLTVTYDGTAKIPELSVTGADGTVNYYFYLGDERVDEVIGAGIYTVYARLSSTNYILKDSFDDGYVAATLTVNKADMQVTLETLTYTGEPQSPVVSVFAANFVTTFAKVTAGVTGDYSSVLPVDAGVYAVKIVDTEGNYNDYDATFTVARASVDVTWSADENAIFADGSFVWLYDGKSHVPSASVTGLDRAAIEVTVTGAQTSNSGSGSYTATAVISDDNYALSNATQTFKIWQSRVNSVVWYEYDGKPVNGNLSYQYISVYGADGPKLKAYGVLESRTASNVWTGKTDLLIELAVSYSTASGTIPSSGYWNYSTEGVEYTATASLKSADRANTNCSFINSLTGAAVQQTFKVTGLVIVNDTVTVYWVIENEDGTHKILNGETPVAAEFDYNGRAQAPMAIIPGESYSAENPVAGAYTVLSVGGANVNAGSYRAFITSTEYNFAQDDCYFAYTVKALELQSVEWSGNSADGKFEWAYNGILQGPSAYGISADGSRWELEVSGAINAGGYTARAYAGANFTFGADCELTHAYTITKLDISGYVVWSANGATVKTDGDGNTYYEYTVSDTNPGAKFGPSATFSVTVNGNVISGEMTVLGKSSQEGSHRAYAFMPGGFEYANFSVSGVYAEFRVVRSSLPKVHWALSMNGNEPGAEETGEIVYTYTGEKFCPVAYFIDEKGEKVVLNVLGSGTDAGVYEAVIYDNGNNFANGTVRKFTVQPRTVTVALNPDAPALYYNGEVQSPSVIFAVSDISVRALGENDYTVSGATEAGMHTATVKLLNKNYVIAGSGTVEFVINKQEIVITWGTEAGKAYNGESFVPAISRATLNGATINLADYGITVTGAESNVGTYTAHAVTSNPNYALTGADKQFEITKFEITVTWTGNEGRDGAFEWSYDGTTSFKPSATFTDWNNEVRELLVMGGAVDAGTYTATAIAPENCTFKYTSGDNAGTHYFNVIQSEITEIEWVIEGYTGVNDGVYSFTYNADVPSITAFAVSGGVRIAELSVTGVGSEAGEYTAVASPANAENSAFSPDVIPEIKVVIVPLDVTVEWLADDGTLPVGNVYTWTYDGKEHSLSAKFTGVNGEEFTVPVNGGKATAVSEFIYRAVAEDVFNNYNFTSFRNIQINPASLTVKWTGGEMNDDGAYGFIYNGKAQMPVVSIDENVQFVYTVKDSEGKIVAAAIDAGTYTVSAKLIGSVNYTVVEESATVNMVIAPRKVDVHWGETVLEYNGAAQAPVAWFVDANNQTVYLAASGTETEVGNGYTATVTLTDKNYLFTDGGITATQTFSVVKTTTDELEWDFGGNGWQQPAAVPPAIDPDEGENAEITG